MYILYMVPKNLDCRIHMYVRTVIFVFIYVWLMFMSIHMYVHTSVQPIQSSRSPSLDCSGVHAVCGGLSVAEEGVHLHKRHLLPGGGYGADHNVDHSPSVHTKGTRVLLCAFNITV